MRNKPNGAELFSIIKRRFLLDVATNLWAPRFINLATIFKFRRRSLTKNCRVEAGAFLLVSSPLVPRAISWSTARDLSAQVKAPAKREAVYGKFSYAHNFLPHMVEHDLKVNGKKTE